MNLGSLIELFFPLKYWSELTLSSLRRNPSALPSRVTHTSPGREWEEVRTHVHPPEFEEDFPPEKEHIVFPCVQWTHIVGVLFPYSKVTRVPHLSSGVRSGSNTVYLPHLVGPIPVRILRHYPSGWSLCTCVPLVKRVLPSHGTVATHPPPFPRPVCLVTRGG